MNRDRTGEESTRELDIKFRLLRKQMRFLFQTLTSFGTFKTQGVKFQIYLIPEFARNIAAS